MAYYFVTATPDSINFGDVPVGVEKSLTVRLSVRSIVPLLPVRVNVVIVPPAGVTSSVTGSRTITTDSPLDIVLTWKPEDPVVLDQNLTVQVTNDSSEKLVHVIGQGVGELPGAVFVSPPYINFGVEVVGEGSGTPVMVGNSEDAGGDLTILSAQIVQTSDAFDNDCPVGYPFILHPGQWVSLPVNFHPHAKGMFMGVLQYRHDGANMPSPVGVILAGQGSDLYTFTSGEYQLKDKSVVRVTIKLHHSGVPDGYIGGVLSAYGVELCDPGEGDILTDLGELVTYPATRSFTLDDSQGFLAKLLVDDQETVGEVLVKYERKRDGETEWTTKMEGAVEPPIQFNDDLGDNKLTFNVTVGTDVLSKLAMDDLFLPPGYNLDGPGLTVSFPIFDSTRYGRLAKVVKGRLDQLENVVDLLTYIFSAVYFTTTNDQSTFDPDSFSFDVDVPFMYADDDAGTNAVPFSQLPLSSTGIWLQSDQGRGSVAEFLHSLCVGYGIRIEVVSAKKGVIKAMYHGGGVKVVPTEAAATGRDAELHVHHEKGADLAKSPSGIQVFAGGADASIIGLPPSGDFVDKCNFAMTNGYLPVTRAPLYNETSRDGDNIQVVVPSNHKGYTNMVDGATYLKQAQATGQFWWKWLSGKNGERIYKLTLMGLDYNFMDIIQFRDEEYFPIRITEKDLDCLTDFELVKIS